MLQRRKSIIQNQPSGTRRSKRSSTGSDDGKDGGTPVGPLAVTDEPAPEVS